MGGLLHIFESKQGKRMAKKVHAHKRHHGGGLEAPRNSLDLQVEASQNHCPEGELPDHCQAEEDYSEDNHNSNAGSMKKLINEELSKKSSTRQNAPSLVARLMGLDMMPIDTKSVVPSERIISEEDKGKKFSKKEMDGRGSISSNSSHFNSSRKKMELDSLYEKIDDDEDGWSRSFGKPRSREHPQEEELQKFKKEFEAYQAARFLDCSSKVNEIGSVSRTRRLLPQEENYMNKEKVMTHNSSSSNKHADFENYPLKPDLPDSVGSMQKQSFPSARSRTLSRDFEESLMMKSCGRLDRSSSSPTRIVILKPGPDSIWNHEESSWSSSSSTLHGGRNSIEDFLEEVRDRLRCELQLQGKTDRKGSSVVVRGSGIETHYEEKPSDPKQIARHIVKQVRETASGDAETALLRSESTRSYKSEMQHKAALSSPEEYYVSGRLKYVDIPEVISSRNSSRTHALVDNHRIRPKQTTDVMTYANEMSNNWEISKKEKQAQTRSFRHDDSYDKVLLQRELSSPRNLVRSLSAPVVSGSGTSFGKLLLEDRHVLTGAHIRRKLEAVETMSVDVKKQKKDRFNIKEKVSNFRYSLGLRGGRLFGGRRNQSMVESYGHDYEYYGPMVRDVTSGPTVLMNFGERHENSTEVPPSPASVCSSVHEEFWRRTEYLSPISTPDVSSRGDDNVAVPHVFRDISSGLNEIRRQLNQLDSDASEDLTTIKREPVESEVLVQLEDPAECYIRDLLVASGLYYGSWDKSLLRGDTTFAKPIGKSVFEEVEESHKKLIKEKDERSSTKDHNNENNIIDHRLLLDLLNEALSIVLGGPTLTTLSGFRRKLSNSSMMLMTPPPCGKELLKLVWDIICVSLYPPSSDLSSSYSSLDSLVAQHLGSIPWSGFINDEINILEREIECLITEDLIEELTKDIL